MDRKARKQIHAKMINEKRKTKNQRSVDKKTKRKEKSA